MYQQKLGCLLFASVTCRPDLSYIASQLAQYSRKPVAENQLDLERALQYFISTPDIGLSYSTMTATSFNLNGYVDADHAADPANRRSRTGFVFRLEPTGPISWNSQKQELVALSSAEAEYIATTAAVREGLYLQELLQEAKIPTSPTFRLHCDNQSAIKIANKPGFVNRTKHIALRYFFVKDEIDQGKVDLAYCPTTEMAADFLTKRLPRQQYKHCSDLTGVVKRNARPRYFAPWTCDPRCRFASSSAHRHIPASPPRLPIATTPPDLRQIVASPPRRLIIATSPPRLPLVAACRISASSPPIASCLHSASPPLCTHLSPLPALCFPPMCTHYTALFALNYTPWVRSFFPLVCTLRCPPVSTQRPPYTSSPHPLSPLSISVDPLAPSLPHFPPSFTSFAPSNPIIPFPPSHHFSSSPQVPTFFCPWYPSLPPLSSALPPCPPPSPAVLSPVSSSYPLRAASCPGRIVSLPHAPFYLSPLPSPTCTPLERACSLPSDAVAHSLPVAHANSFSVAHAKFLSVTHSHFSYIEHAPFLSVAHAHFHSSPSLIPLCRTRTLPSVAHTHSSLVSHARPHIPIPSPTHLHPVAHASPSRRPRIPIPCSVHPSPPLPTFPHPSPPHPTAPHNTAFSSSLSS
ncbi:unnamed protein product [Closterium sp. NIES-64]|nr:unnamed protein product [Closterium sp. NIES-64]